MAKRLFMPEFLRFREQFGLEDDFPYYVSGDLWTSLAADAGSSVAEDADGEGGVVKITTGATDNNEAAAISSNELIIFADDRPIHFVSRLNYTEANTDDANIAAGFADAAGANLLLDNGGGANINSSGALIYKKDGETQWRCASKNNSVTKEDLSGVTAGGSYQLLEIVVNPVDSTNVEITYFVDGVQLRDSNNVAILHRLATTSATQMDIVAGYAKAGGGNSEVLDVDLCACYQKRA